MSADILLHLLLDAMWQQPETLWWPFLGLDFSPAGAATVGEYLRGVVTDWRVWALETVGLIYLVVLARRGRLEDRDMRRQFAETGRIDVAIEQR